MATTEVYSPTTAPNPKASWFLVPSEHLDTVRFTLKVFQVVSSNAVRPVAAPFTRIYPAVHFRLTSN